MVGILSFLSCSIPKPPDAMKYLSYFFMILLLAACQKEELRIVDGTDEEAFAIDQELKDLMFSVVAHDGSFDDVVDNSSCFSIDFPYRCTYNGHEYPMNNVQDLEPWPVGANLMPVFPVNITFANYLQASVPDEKAFSFLQDRCANGDLFDDIINCVDIVYPVSVSLYNTATSDFETINFLHDKQTFQSMEDLDENVLISINYPVQIILENEVVLTIESNDILKDEILDRIPFCE